MHKGDIVRVKATVYSGRESEYRYMAEVIHKPKKGTYKRCLWRIEEREPWLGMIIGFSFRQTGEIVYSWSGDFLDDYRQGRLIPDKYHYVYLVEQIVNNRWLTPAACLPEDLKVVGDAIYNLAED